MWRGKSQRSLRTVEEFLSASLKKMDELIAKNYRTWKCEDVFNAYHQFFLTLKDFRGTSTGFTGLSELLIFRFLYHLLGGQFRKKNITKDLKEFVSDDFRIGSIPIVINGKRIFPDISIYYRKELIAVIQIKTYLTRGINELRKEVDILKKIKTRNPKMRALLIIFALSKRGKIVRELEKLRKTNKCFNFLILQENKEPLMQKLQQLLGLERITHRIQS